MVKASEAAGGGKKLVNKIGNEMIGNQMIKSFALFSFIAISSLLIISNIYQENVINRRASFWENILPALTVSQSCGQSQAMKEGYSDLSEIFTELNGLTAQLFDEEIQHRNSLFSNRGFLPRSIDPNAPAPCVDTESIAVTNFNIAERIKELQTYLESQTSNSQPTQAALPTKQPTFEELFRSYYQDRTQSVDPVGDFQLKEHEPFIYSRLQPPLPYRLSGLRNLTAGEEGEVTLDTFGAVLPHSPAELVRILLYGIAVLSPLEWAGDERGVWVARLRVPDPGVYRVYVESVYRPNASVHLYRTIEGSPFTLLVRPAGSEGVPDEQARPPPRPRARRADAAAASAAVLGIRVPT